jgi:hypothetical protein
MPDAAQVEAPRARMFRAPERPDRIEPELVWAIQDVMSPVSVKDVDGEMTVSKQDGPIERPPIGPEAPLPAS